MSFIDLLSDPSDLNLLGSTESQPDPMGSITNLESKTASELREEFYANLREFYNALAASSGNNTTVHHEDGHSTQAPIKKLPPKVLSLIFAHCREGMEPTLLPPSCWFPWALGQVCSEWKRVLWRVSDIWSDIQIRSDMTPDEEYYLTVIFGWVMARTHSPISLEMPLLGIGNLVSIIFLYASRFRSLRLTLDFHLLEFFLTLKLDLTSLKSLEVIVAEHHLPNFALSHRENALPNASQLDEFSISYPYNVPIYALRGLSLRWSQLTFFECHGAHSIVDLHEVLLQCTALDECSVAVRAAEVEETANYDPRPIVLPRLRTFRTAPFGGHMDWMMFLKPFILPSLDVLTCDVRALGEFEALVARSGCRLRQLETFMNPPGLDLLEADDLHILRMSPSLVLLSITTIALSPAVFGLISGGEILPNLATFNCVVKPNGLGAFLDLMEQFPPEHGIRTAHISLDHELSEDDDVARRIIRACERFVEEGRNINIETLD